MAVIKVPKTPRQAYNTNRPAGDLLKKQIEHLEWAVRPASQRSPKQMKLRIAKTEGEAAAQIAKLTEKLRRVSAAAPPAGSPQDPAAVQARNTEKAQVMPGAESAAPRRTRARAATRRRKGGKKRGSGR